MPPDHGAAVARIILLSPELTGQWQHELETMRRRILSFRNRLAQAHPALEPLREQTGMFGMLPIDQTTVRHLRDAHGIYVADDGRINLAGLQDQSLQRLTLALLSYLDER